MIPRSIMGARIWDKAKVMAAIRRLKRAGESIAYSDVHGTNAALSSAAARHFGTYRAAVIAAGIDYDRRVRKQQHWSKGLVIKAIRRRLRAKQDLAPGHLSQYEKPLYLAAVHHFGSYRAAVEAAGIDYEKVLRPPGHRWPEHKVLAEIKRQHRLGRDLAHNAIQALERRQRFLELRQRLRSVALGVEAAAHAHEAHRQVGVIVLAV